MKIQLLMSPGCSHGQRALALILDVVGQAAPGAEVETIEVATPEDAVRLSFPGSPTVRVNGVDIDPEAPKNVGLG
jgi:hypothetical protein